jgi:hypothetical protein
MNLFTLWVQLLEDGRAYAALLGCRGTLPDSLRELLLHQIAVPWDRKLEAREVQGRIRCVGSSGVCRWTRLDSIPPRHGSTPRFPKPGSSASTHSPNRHQGARRP